jgi:hypothetical protein
MTNTFYDYPICPAEKVDAIHNIDEDIRQTTSDIMASMLIDTDINSWEMFEDLLFAYEKGNEDFKRGIDKAMRILLHEDMSEVIDDVLKEVG